MLNEIQSVDGQHTFAIGEWFHGSLPTDVIGLRVITAAWDLDILALHFDEYAAYQRAVAGCTLDDAEVHLLDLALMEAEKELALLAPDGYEVGYDDDGSFGCWRMVDGGEEPADHGYEAYSSFGTETVVW